jgi:aminoglycoside 6'-N-acetyltransferase
VWPARIRPHDATRPPLDGNSIAEPFDQRQAVSMTGTEAQPLPPLPPLPPRPNGERVSLRAGRPDDVAALLRIRHEPSVYRWWREPSESEIAESLRGESDDHLLVIEVDGVLVGGIQYSEEPEPDYRHAGIDIFLTTEMQGRGIGAGAIRLMARFLINTLGHHRLVIDPAADNERAIRCYRSVGFRPVGILRQYERGLDGTFHDGLLMDLLASELPAD